MAFSRGRAFLRRALVWQVRQYEAEVVEADGRPLALVMRWQMRRRLVEIAFCFMPEARRHMPALVRLAQLTLARMRQDGLLAMVRIRTTDARAHRMARLAGFRRTPLAGGTIWTGRGP
jgi:mRNA-degrading endonuclease toxin of MazEF toxin-antitoxin module